MSVNNISISERDSKHRIIGVDGFQRRKTGILDNIDGAHPQQHLVFDDQYGGLYRDILVSHVWSFSTGDAAFGTGFN